MKRLTTLILFLVLVAVVAANASEYCDICDSEITGEHYTFSNDDFSQIICRNCVESLGRCSFCGVPVKYTRSTDKDIVCYRCRRTAKRCSVCNDIIYHQYFTDSSNHIFCQNCYKNADRCDFCRAVLLPGEWSYQKQKKVCNVCKNVRPRCYACNSVLGTVYSEFRGFDGKYCPECVASTPSCVSCMRPCGNNPFRISNGHAVCRDCHRSTVTTGDQLQRLVAEVAGYMERNLLMQIETSIDIKLVDSVDGMELSDRYRESGRFIRVGDDFTIKILAGLSRELCIETIAHELAHAWQAENCPHLAGDELIEGFAQWIAGKVLTGFNLDRLIERLDYRDDVYGRGYRRLISMEKKYGFSGVFRELVRLGGSR